MDFGRYVLGSLVAAAMLAGCGESQPPIGVPGTMAQIRATATHAGRGGSWMQPDAKNQDLLYVSSDNDGNVYVYSYPQLKRVGKLGSLNFAAGGECVNKMGEVFIATSNEQQISTIYEYQHGGTQPIAELNEPGLASGCAIDLKTGNLAVANVSDRSNPYSAYGGDVAVFANAQGAPTMYYNAVFERFFFCGYDDSGNLYLSAQDEHTGAIVLARLSSGSQLLQLIHLNEELVGGHLFEPSVQWDGKHMTVSSGAAGAHWPLSIYRLSISGKKAVVIGTTTLESTTNKHFGQSWIHGDNIIGIDNKLGSGVAVWHYPKGGSAFDSLHNVGNTLWGVTMSPATPR